MLSFENSKIRRNGVEYRHCDYSMFFKTHILERFDGAAVHSILYKYKYSANGQDYTKNDFIYLFGSKNQYYCRNMLKNDII